MRHRNKKIKIGRSPQQRKALLKTMASALILKERIFTTEIKAKKLRSFVEKVISRSKEDKLVNRRLLFKIFSPRIVDRLFKEIGPRYRGCAGGYTRIIKSGSRKADAAKMVLIELIKK
jgi:large subunit ribosomal protein L17